MDEFAKFLKTLADFELIALHKQLRACPEDKDYLYCVLEEIKRRQTI